jgi:hypothetical protein
VPTGRGLLIHLSLSLVLDCPVRLRHPCAYGKGSFDPFESVSSALGATIWLLGWVAAQEEKSGRSVVPGTSRLRRGNWPLQA